jgi:hypothetical protein
MRKIKKAKKKYTAILVRLVDKKGNPVSGVVHVDAKAQVAGHFPVISATEIVM